jgi:hypothetical protein
MPEEKACMQFRLQKESRLHAAAALLSGAFSYAGLAY